MLIIDRNQQPAPLPIYEVQEVSVKEALVMLTAREENVAYSLFNFVENLPSFFSQETTDT